MYTKQKKEVLPLPLQRGPNVPPLDDQVRKKIRKAAQQQQRESNTVGGGAPTARQKDKFVPLPDEDGEELHYAGALTTLDEETGGQLQVSPTLFEDLPHNIRDDSNKGRITLYCIADRFDRDKLDDLLRSTYPVGTVYSYPDAFYIAYIAGANGCPGGDVFFFDYGVVACWGLTKTQEMTLVKGLATHCQLDPLSERDMEVESFKYNFTSLEKSHVQNDCVTLHRKYAQNHKMKLAITYALAQATKLAVYERRVTGIVLETKPLPQALADHGEVRIPAQQIAKLIGKVFLQKSAVNLLSSVLDTPEFFWHEVDTYQSLYERLVEYLELDVRVELLNSRFSVLQEMLDMLRDHQNNHHNTRLEWIVISLIVVEVIVGLFELLGLFGLVGRHPRE